MKIAKTNHAPAKKSQKHAPRVLTARDLIKLATRVDPRTQVLLHFGGRYEFARADSDRTGHAEIELDDGTCLCIVLAAAGKR